MIVLRSAACLAWLCVACHNDPDALYAGATDAGATSRLLPLLPALPDQDAREACDACAREQCSSARAACLEDTACTELLACKGRCDEPTCLKECEADHGFSPWYADVWECVMNGACATECQSGENWGCVGAYDLPVATESNFPVTYRVQNPRSSPRIASASRLEMLVAGVTARTCVAADGPCTLNRRIDEGRFDASDSVTLDVAVPNNAQSFDGMLELEDPSYEAPGLRTRIATFPVARSLEVQLVVVSSQSLGIPPRTLEVSAPLVLFVGDCLSTPARGFRVELPEAPDAELVYDTGYALLPDVPPPARADWLTVDVVRDDTGDLVAERDVFVRGGWITTVYVRPQAR